MKKKLIAVASGLLVVVLLSGGGCGSTEDIPQDDPQAAENFKAQKKNDPLPTLTDSLERGNIIEHLKRNNQADRIRYIYLMNDVGGVYAFYTIKGKVTSTGAQLTPTDSIVDPCSSSYCPEVVQGPTDDGSFGGDEGGVYFFTDTGEEVQWNGKWLVFDSPMKINGTPTLTVIVK